MTLQTLHIRGVERMNIWKANPGNGDWQRKIIAYCGDTQFELVFHTMNLYAIETIHGGTPATKDVT